jgi:hypothetical protein
MVVTSNQGLTWRHAEMPGYEILSCCPVSMTRDFMLELARAETLVQYLFPKEYWAKSDVPRVIILSIPENLRLMPRELLNEDNGNPSLIYRGERLNLDGSEIIPNIELSDQDCSMVFATLDPLSFDRERFKMHPAHVRVLLTDRRPPWPDWLVAGVANLYAGLYQGDTFTIPNLEWIAGEQTGRKSGKTRVDQENELKRFIPLHEMLTHHPSPGSAEWPVWNAQATLFVRWALCGELPSREKAFWRFAARTADGEPATESMFREAFGHGYDQALVELNEYLAIAIKSPVEVRLPKTTPVIPNIRPASETEILRIKEDWTRLVAVYLKTRFPEAAPLDNRHRAAIRACENGNMDPRLLAAVGLYESDMAHDVSARAFLESATESKVVRPRAYYELARLRYAMVRRLDGGPISAVEADWAVAPLLVAFGQSPALKDSYSLATKIWLNSELILTPGNLQLLNRGPELFPEDLGLLYNVASLNHKYGSKEDAMHLVERGLRLSIDPEMSAEFEKLRSN